MRNKLMLGLLVLGIFRDRTFSAGRVGEMRLREVEIHHADLDLAYTWADPRVRLA